MTSFATRLVRLLMVVAVLVSLSCQSDPLTPDEAITIKGTITDEGVECLALREEAGDLYTLTGLLDGYGPGDKVCVRGTVAEISYCMQGTTIVVDWIVPAADCD